MWLCIFIVAIVVILLFVTKSSHETFTTKSSSFSPINTRYLSQNYYGFPFNRKYGEGWPQGLYSKLYYWSPSYFTVGSGMVYYYRPTAEWNPYSITRNRWVRNNGGYYNVSNRTDYINDAADYYVDNKSDCCD